MKAMKKLIAISLVAVMLFALAVPSTAHVWYTTEQNTTGFISGTDKEIAVNAGKLPEGATVELGASDSDWQYAYPYTLNKKYAPGMYNTGVDADIYVMYDSTNLYIKEVRRDTIVDGDYSNYKFIVPGKELSADSFAPVGTLIGVKFNAAATADAAAANTVSTADRLSYKWSPDNVGAVGNYKQHTALSDLGVTVTSYSRVEGDTFVVETAIPWAGIADGASYDAGSYIGLMHQTTTGGANLGYYKINKFTNVGSGHTSGNKVYHDEWDGFNALYLRDVNENASSYAIDYSWYNTTDTEFTLTTVGQLRGLAALINQQASLDAAKAITAGKTFKLGANMDLNPDWDTTSALPHLYNWIPIGAFAGTLDGQGYEISNMIAEPGWSISKMTGKSYESWERDMGLIAFGCGDITIKDLSLTDSVVKSNFCAAGLIAKVKEAAATVKIQNVYVDADVSIDVRTTNSKYGYGNSNSYAGILMGRGMSSAANWATIENVVCAGSLEVITRNVGSTNLGGVGSGPVWGTSAGSAATISDVLVMLDKNIATSYDIDTTTLEEGKATAQSFRTKYIANSGSWTESNTVYINPDDGSLTYASSSDGMNYPGDYPETWVEINNDGVMMPAAVAMMATRNIWVQETAPADGYIDLRVLTVTDKKWDNVGVKIETSADGAEFTELTASEPLTTNTYYSSVLADGNELTAEAMGGRYVACLTQQIPATGTVVVRITPVKYVGETAYTGRTSTITYVDGIPQ